MRATKQPTRVSEIMSSSPVTVEPGTTIRQLARILEENEISGVPVVDQDDRVVGVVSKSDLIRRLWEGSQEEAPGYLFELLSEEAGEDVELMPEPLVVVGDFMTEDVVTVSPSDAIPEVAHQMAEAGIHRVIVVDRDGCAVGVVTSLDILRVYPAR
jgi:CBS domain-containing protein